MKITFIGGGNMTAALAAGIAKTENPANIFVIDRNAEKRRAFRDLGINAAAAPESAPPDADILILAVKPPDMRAACQKLPQTAAAIVSVAAGPALQTIAEWLPFAPKNIARAMPNTPAAAAAGMSVCCGEVGEKAKADISAVFASVGKVLWLNDESMLSAAVAVSGAGPAYLFYFAEAMMETAQNMGFSAADARLLVCQTLQGGGEMLAHGEKSAAELRRAVMSKGGATERAIAAMESEKLKEIVAAAMNACHARAVEMAKIPPA